MKLLLYVDTLRRILNHSIWINITQLMTQKQELLQNKGQNVYLNFNLKLKGLMVGFSSWLLLDIRKARSWASSPIGISSSELFRLTYCKNTVMGSRGKSETPPLDTHTHMPSSKNWYLTI